MTSLPTTASLQGAKPPKLSRNTPLPITLPATILSVLSSSVCRYAANYPEIETKEADPACSATLQVLVLHEGAGVCLGVPSSFRYCTYHFQAIGIDVLPQVDTTEDLQRVSDHF
jgi:hypothetical protein